VQLRELVAAGEPLNPEIIDRVRDAWGLSIRDDFGQTESSVMIANTPGQPIAAGKVGKPPTDDCRRRLITPANQPP
jgi:acetyl-CoA synthetase